MASDPALRACPGCPDAKRRSARTDGCYAAVCHVCGAEVLARPSREPPPPPEPTGVRRVPPLEVEPPAPPVVWKPSAAADMRILARWAPRAMLRAVDPEPKAIVGTGGRAPDPVARALVREESAWIQLVYKILARLDHEALDRPRGLEVRVPARQLSAPCEACAAARAPWLPPLAPKASGNRSDRRKVEVEHRPRVATQAAGLGDVLRFAYEFHTDQLEIPPDALNRHVGWHFAPGAQRAHWRQLTSSAQRDSELFALGIVLVDSAVAAYDRLEDDARVTELGRAVEALTAPWHAPR